MVIFHVAGHTFTKIKKNLIPKVLSLHCDQWCWQLIQLCAQWWKSAKHLILFVIATYVSILPKDAIIDQKTQILILHNHTKLSRSEIVEINSLPTLMHWRSVFNLQHT